MVFRCKGYNTKNRLTSDTNISSSLSEKLNQKKKKSTFTLNISELTNCKPYNKKNWTYAWTGEKIPLSKEHYLVSIDHNGLQFNL